MTFGQYLKEQRKLASLTQSELAQKLDVSTITIRQYESNRRSPSEEMKIKIASAIGLNFADFMRTYYEAAAQRTDSVCQSDRLSKALNALNDAGQEKVAIYAEDLSKVPEYRREDGAASGENAPDTSDSNPRG